MSARMTPLDMAKRTIDKIKESKHMNIMCEWREELIIEQAEESTRRYEKGSMRSDFEGIPIVLKDQIKIKGLTVRYGMPFPENQPCSEDAAVVERLRNAGMVIIGLVNMHQVEKFHARF